MDRRALERGPGLVRRRDAISSGPTSPTTACCASIEPSGQVSVFREPSNNSNGNTVDNQGRLVTCEHLTRRVTRTEVDGSISVVAEAMAGQAAQLPQRRRRQVGRFHLVHRSGLRHRQRQRGRSGGAGDRRLPRLPRRPERRSRARHRRHGASERPRLFARRKLPLRRRHRRRPTRRTGRAISAVSRSCRKTARA